MDDHVSCNWEFLYAIQYTNWKLESNLDHRNIGNHQLIKTGWNQKSGQLGQNFRKREDNLEKFWRALWENWVPKDESHIL